MVTKRIKAKAWNSVSSILCKSRKRYRDLLSLSRSGCPLEIALAAAITSRIVPLKSVRARGMPTRWRIINYTLVEEIEYPEPRTKHEENGQTSNKNKRYDTSCFLEVDPMDHEETYQPHDERETNHSSKNEKISGSNSSNIENNISGNNSNNGMIDVTGMIPDELWTNHILPFVGMGQFAVVAPVSRRMKRLYLEFGSKVLKPPHFNLSGRTTIINHGDCNSKTQPMDPYCTTVDAAVENLACIQYYVSKFPHGWTHYCHDAPSYHPYYWLYEHACDAAARLGHLEVLKWAHKNCRRCDIPRTMNVAAEFGRMNILQWMREPEQNMHWNYYTLKSVASGCGDLDILKWLKVHRSVCH